MNPSSNHIASINPPFCPYDGSKMDMLIECTQQNGVKLDVLCEQNKAMLMQHNNIIKYLLFVVCLIALGSKLVETAQSVWGHKTTITTTGEPH